MTESEYLQVFETYRMYIFYFCDKLINNTQEAEDITIILFMKLWTNKEKVPIDKAKAFLMVSANHNCQDYFKTHNKYNKVLESFSMRDMEEVEINTEVLTYLYKLIDTLRPQERRMILLKYQEGKDVKEISKLLKTSPQTASNTLNTGLKKIRELINKKAH